MDFLVQYIIPYLVVYKYLAIFIVSFLTALIIPIPSGSVLMTTAALASIGYFNITLVVIISIIANILGDNIGYWLSYKFGSKILSNVGFRFILQSDRFKVIEHKFRAHPGFIIFISRFEVLSTLFVNLISGMGKIPYKKYLLHELSGTILQVLLYSLIGYLFGYNLQSITSFIGKLFLGIIFVLFLLFITFRKKIFSITKK